MMSADTVGGTPGQPGGDPAKRYRAKSWNGQGLRNAGRMKETAPQTLVNHRVTEVKKYFKKV
jgi:hypothetical protein